MYLNHAYDNEYNINSGDLTGSRNVFIRMEDGTFNDYPWRSAHHSNAFSPAKHKPPFFFGRHRRVKVEDLDCLDSEEEDECRIADEEKEEYVDMW